MMELTTCLSSGAPGVKGQLFHQGLEGAERVLKTLCTGVAK